MTQYVVDENVPIVANDISGTRTPQANADCRGACITVLRNVVRSGVVVIDDAGEVLAKYRVYLNGRGQPGVGDAFLRHVSDRQFDRRRVLRAALALNEAGEYQAFPNDPALSQFDHADRIFVALAAIVPGRPTLLNAVDSDYSEFADALKAAGIRIRELCPDCIRAR